MSDDREQLKQVAVEAALAASQVLESYYGKIKNISVKRHAGLVTEADKAAEAKVIAIIQGAFPSHAILAEESGEQGKGSEYKWIIDPLDGTTNYAHQIPFFCASIGVEKRGEVIVAAVTDPTHRDLYVAVKGKGAFKNDRKLSVSTTRELKDALLGTGFAYQKGAELAKAVDILKPFMEITQGVRRCGSAVWDLCQVADGHFDGFWERNLQPWDVAAGSLFIQEAGGRVSQFDGSPSTVYDHQIVASNGRIHQQMIDIIMEAAG